jgi:BirA family biotin operon repressor/biotin-[acetyl-CoA-carboxylase] ligase
MLGSLSRARDLLPSFFDPVEVVEFLPSTMIRAAELAAGGAPEGAIVLADHQTAGRGRLGRTWLAPPGTSLMLSVVLRPGLPPSRAWAVATAAGLALAEAADDLMGAAGRPGLVALKWPNDLLLGPAKAAGLLAESRDGGIVLLGMGVNVGQAAGDFPAELRAGATSLSAAAGAPIDRGALLAAWAPRFVAAYQDLRAGRPGLVAAWRARLATIGRDVRVDRVDADPLLGRAVDVDPDGGLVLRLPDGTMATVPAGDVDHLQPGA